MEWFKALVPIIVAVIALVQTGANMSRAEVNCDAITNIKVAMREIILAAPIDPDHPDESRRFAYKSLNLIDEADCG